MVYLRPPKNNRGYNIPTETALGVLRKGIVHDWTSHALVEHGWTTYPLVGAGTKTILTCAECKDYQLQLYETERVNDND